MQNAPKLKAAIVGSGLAGLSTAVELLDQGYEVDIYESRPFIGGKVASWQKDGNHVEMGLHVVSTGSSSYSCKRRTTAHTRRLLFRPAYLVPFVMVLLGAGLPIYLFGHVFQRATLPAQFFGCCFNLFCQMAKCGVLQNVLCQVASRCLEACS